MSVHPSVCYKVVSALFIHLSDSLTGADSSILASWGSSILILGESSMIIILGATSGLDSRGSGAAHH